MLMGNLWCESLWQQMHLMHLYTTLTLFLKIYRSKPGVGILNEETVLKKQNEDGDFPL